VKFHKIEFKNFLSYGAAPTVINLDYDGITCIVGRNGAGKSSILEAICFALFGKAYRAINKGDLVNTVNKKESLVTLYLSHKGHDYRIVRGMSPNVFEIYDNDVLIPIPPDVREYQNKLQALLRINYKNFTQSIFIGNAGFTPFIQLSAAERRKVVDNLLDIDVLGVMLTNVTKDLSATVTRIAESKNTIVKNKIEVDGYQQVIDVIKNQQTSLVNELDSKIESLDAEIASLGGRLDGHTTALQIAKDGLALVDKQIESEVSGKTAEINKLKWEIQQFKVSIEKMGTDTICPHCYQSVSEEHRQKVRDGFESSLNELTPKLKLLTKERDEKEFEYAEKRKEFEATVTAERSEISTINGIIAEKKKTKSGLLEEKKKASSNNSELLEDTKKKMKDVIDRTNAILKERKKDIQLQGIQEQAQQLLRDSGIKSYIIGKYLPMINNSINERLDAMEFPATFAFDNEFKERIFIRRRDDVSYFSLSQGERQRVDMAILFTLRHIAARIHGADSNLLILDETFDSSLDDTACNYLLKHLKEHEKSVVIITHNDSVAEQADRLLTVKKNGNFSEIKIE